MKKSIVQIALIAFITLGAVSCKDGAKESKTSEAKETLSATAKAVPFTIKNANSTIAWSGSKPVGTHTGTINIQEGIIYANGGAIEGGNVTIDMTSITVTDLDENSGKGSLEAHLKGTVEGKEGDFFNITKYPTASFEITGVAEVDGATMMSGNLIMLEKSNNITFPVMITTQDNTLHIKSEAFGINRTKWGINYGSKSIFDDLGDKFISDTMEIIIDVTAAK